MWTRVGQMRAEDQKNDMQRRRWEHIVDVADRSTKELVHHGSYDR